MEKRFKYGKFDRRARRITVVAFALIGIAVFLLWYFWGEGGYVMAWTVSFLMAVLTLYVLSVPRDIKVGEDVLEIRCVLDITRLPAAEIKYVRRVEREEMRWVFVLAGSFGFFGYFGIFFDIRNRETVRLYCREWNNFVEFTDIYGKRYIVSCPRVDELMDEAIALRRKFAGRREV